jgi:hypothetical protein
MSHSTTSSCRTDPDTTAKEIIAVPQEAPASAVETPITVSSIIELDSHIMDLLLSQTLTGTEDTTTAIRGCGSRYTSSRGSKRESYGSKFDGVILVASC